jgi:hypothetical protein
MAIPELLAAQNDFSAGELDPEMKRRDDQPIYKAGGRQMRNFRILNSAIIEQRPGRRALYLQTGRVDQVAVTPPQDFTYDLCFGGDGSLAVRDSTGATLASQPAATYPWRTATVNLIVWTKVNVGFQQTDVVITFPGMKPALASFDGVGTWTFPVFNFSLDGQAIPLVPYLRVSAPGATMTPSATGAAGAAITAIFSSPVLSAARIGTLMRFANRRLVVTAVADATHGTFTCLDALFRTQQLTVAHPDGAVGGTGVEGFAVGTVVEGSLSGSTGEVVAVNLGGSTITVQITNFASGFLVSGVGAVELAISPTGKSKVTAVADVAPLAAVTWDEQLISEALGWPQSCAVDAGRLIFCDLPAAPEAVLWSATNSPFNFGIGANATDAICELIAGKPRVYHVGPWIDEIVFTNNGIYYIPINTTNPLKPGSVTFQKFSPEAASTVKPVFTSDGYLYVNEGRNSIKAIIATGAAFSTKPYGLEDITQFHRHLFSAGPVAIALATGDGQVPERYVYVVNADGTVVTGKYETGKQWVGWTPWDGEGAVKWVSALHAAVRFVSVYPVIGIAAGVSVGEVLDQNEYVDAAILINAPPAQMTPGGGQGPFYWLRLGSVQLMDGVRPLGLHAIDPNGFIVPAYEGEDLSIATITGGLAYTPIFEPFIRGGPPGENHKQRTLRRNLGRMVVTVKNSTGFTMASLYSGPATPTSPAQGSVVKQRVIPPWNQGDDQAAAPPLREYTYRQRFTGRNYDQRCAVFKDVPGPIQIIEVAQEISV